MGDKIAQVLGEQVLNVEAFAPTPSINEFISDVDAAIREIDAERPLTEDITRRLNEQILYDRVFSSAVTEGNRLSLRETIAVLTGGIVEAGKRKDADEVKNLAEAIVYVGGLIDSGAKITAVNLREIHSIILNNINDEEKGRYRREDVAISGAAIIPPSHIDVPLLIEALFESEIIYNERYHPLQKAAWIHWAIVRVHPFKDGNGRVARLIQDYVLLKDRYVPATIQATDRESAYYSALEDADMGHGTNLLELIAKNTIKTSDKYLSIIREGKEKESWIAGVISVATEKVRQTEHREFLAIQRSCVALKTEFKSVCEQLNKEIPQLSIRFKDYGGIDFDRYKELKKYGKTRRTWDFGIELTIHTVTTLKYMFWHAAHFRNPDDVFAECPSKSILLVSCEENGYYQKLDDLIEDKVTLRELVPLGNGFLRRSKNPILEKYVWDENVSPVKVVRDFMQEVLSKIGLV